jgi:sensor histidine kinase YesM
MKKWIRPTKAEWCSVALILPVLGIMLNQILFAGRAMTEKDIWIFSFPYIMAFGLVAWYLHIFSMHRLRRAFPDISQTPLRLTLLAITNIAATSILFTVLFLSYHEFSILGYVLEIDKFRHSLIIAIALSMIATTFWESDYTLKQWKTSMAEKERLQQLNLQQEFDSLKSQVNPHFLFNCFNTLSSLITEDKEAAETFLNELSKVYRYLLRNNRSSLTTLENELRFIQSYYQLLKTRHGEEALQLHIEVDKRYDQYVLPSSSLQLLVENAVKHNIVSKQSPLIIDIFTAAGNILVVNNNLQTKQSKPLSNNIGLENIRTKYELMNQSGFQVLVDTKNFSVILPLIWCPVMEDHVLSVNEKNIETNTF